MDRSEPAESAARRMMQALVHRGPDEDGILVAPSVALGMRRLSIIDLPGGHQPVFNETGNVGIVFNGEIYNFRQLRQTLEGRGHKFRTHSDTEAILHAYEEWGEACVRELRGMFAFAIWDARDSGSAGDAARRARIFIARDRLGIKPLYYTVADGAFLFASEVRALMASGRVPPKLSPDAVEGYLLFGSVAEPTTLVEGVYSLLPGHSFTFSADAPPAKPAPKAYWNFADAALRADAPAPRDLREAANELRPLLEETVRDHMIADVPLGVFLSSGLDSTALVAIANKVQVDLHTFTVVFPEQRFSEADISRETAKQFKTKHQEILLTPEDIYSQIDDAVGSLDQPTMDGLNTYFVSRAARAAGLKVALSGLGSDEIFGGYSTFASTPRASLVAGLSRWIPRPLRRLSAALAVKVAPGDAVRKAAATWKSPGDFPHPYFFTRLLYTPGRVRRLMAPYVESGAYPHPDDSLWRARLLEVTKQALRLDGFTGISCLELQSYMVNTLLRDTDTASMANSLEVRVPFLDHRLVEFVSQLPSACKFASGQPKALLIQALADVLPDDVVHQRKRTFTLPWDVWMRGQLGVRLSQELSNLTPPLLQFMNQHTVRGSWQNFLTGHTSWSRPWSVYVLNQWVRRHITSADTGASSPTPAVRPAAIASSASNPRP